MKRRDFLRNALFSAAGFSAVIFSGCGLRSLAQKFLRRKKSLWIDAGHVSLFEIGKPVKIERKKYLDGRTVSFTVWILTRNKKDFIAFDPLCTHLECAYTYDANARHFICPCHVGIFDLEGNVLSGPAPHALYRYPTNVTDGKLFVEITI